MRFRPFAAAALALLYGQQYGGADMATRPLHKSDPDAVAGGLRVLVVLQALQRSHHEAHLQAQGQTAYTDHMLFERLYTGLAGEIDALSEKLVAIGGPDAVTADRLSAGATMVLGQWGAQRAPAVDRALRAERDLQAAIAQVINLPDLPAGLDNLFRSIADTHDGAIYLLQQRTSPEGLNLRLLDPMELSIARKLAAPGALAKSGGPFKKSLLGDLRFNAGNGRGDALALLGTFIERSRPAAPQAIHVSGPSPAPMAFSTERAAEHGMAKSFADFYGRVSTGAALNGALAKSGGPFIGPHGGKWADAGHKIPWHDAAAGPNPGGAYTTAEQVSEHAAKASKIDDLTTRSMELQQIGRRAAGVDHAAIKAKHAEVSAVADGMQAKRKTLDKPPTKAHADVLKHASALAAVANSARASNKANLDAHHDHFTRAETHREAQRAAWRSVPRDFDAADYHNAKANAHEAQATATGRGVHESLIGQAWARGAIDEKQPERKAAIRSEILTPKAESGAVSPSAHQSGMPAASPGRPATAAEEGEHQSRLEADVKSKEHAKKGLDHIAEAHKHPRSSAAAASHFKAAEAHQQAAQQHASGHPSAVRSGAAADRASAAAKAGGKG